MQDVPMTFSTALDALKSGKTVTRAGWKNPKIVVQVQSPDENSKMTKPYLIMLKNDDIFPLDLSCESIFADDWVVVPDPKYLP